MKLSFTSDITFSNVNNHYLQFDRIGNQISSDRYWYRGVSIKEMRIKKYVKRAEIADRH